MFRLLICTVILAACAAVPKPKAVEDCTDIGTYGYDPRSEVLSETQTIGPSQVIWVHPPQVEHGYLTEAAGRVYRCPTPR
jgi:hypothetical protein